MADSLSEISTNDCGILLLTCLEKAFHVGSATFTTENLCMVCLSSFHFKNETINNLVEARRAGSDGSMSASGSAGPGFDPGGVVNFHFKIFNLGARMG